MTPSEIADWLDSVDRVYNAAGSSTSAHPTDKFAQAAATIRKLEAKLKIATEALEYVSQYSPGRAPINVWIGTDYTRKYATLALARIKEV